VTEIEKEQYQDYLSKTNQIPRMRLIEFIFFFRNKLDHKSKLAKNWIFGTIETTNETHLCKIPQKVKIVPAK